MMIRIRNQKLLKALGFTPSGDGPMAVGLSLRNWLQTIRATVSRSVVEPTTPATSPRLLRFVLYPGPFVSSWPEMPCEVFRDHPAAHKAALEFVARYDAGGYRESDDSYWAREHLPGGFRFTQFVIADTRSASFLNPEVN